jgi:hypothetical protein
MGRRMATRKPKKELRYVYRVREAAWADPRLKGIYLLVFIACTRFGHWDYGTNCHPGDDLEAITGLHRNTISKACRWLVDEGWLVLLRQGGGKGRPRANLYRWQIPGEEPPAVPEPTTEAGKEDAEWRRLAVESGSRILAKEEPGAVAAVLAHLGYTGTDPAACLLTRAQAEEFSATAAAIRDGSVGVVEGPGGRLVVVDGLDLI